MQRSFTLKHLLILLLIGWWNDVTFAQHQYDVWYFGLGVGIDFRPSKPILITNTPAKSAEGIANYCDPKTGSPLFGCDGVGIVYDRNNNPMSNGTNIVAGYGTSSQGSTIVPYPCTDNKFFLINTNFYGYLGGQGGAFYSVVDLSLNGGLGDVTQKNISINTNTDEYTTVVPYGIGPDYWAIFHSQKQDTFFSYRITSTGISSKPVISVCGISTDAARLGYLKASPDGRKLAKASTHEQYASVELFDFDPYTGKVSNPLTLFPDFQRFPNVFPDVGVCFSPDSKKLYFSVLGPYAPNIIQCDVSNNLHTNILSSRCFISDSTVVSPGSYYYRALEIGPDKKIYVGVWSHWLSVIEQPNLGGVNCIFNDKQYAYSRPICVGYGLPNNIEGSNRQIPDSLFSVSVGNDTITSSGKLISILLSMKEKYTELVIHGHYDNSLITFNNVSSDGQQLQTNIDQNNGLFTINLPAEKNLKGIRLDLLCNFVGMPSSSPSIVIDSILFAGDALSCSPLTQAIYLTPECGDITMQKYLLNGGIPSFTINPNPAQNTVSLKSDASCGDVNIQVFDVLGRVLLQKIIQIVKDESVMFDVNSLPSGIYYLKIKSERLVAQKSLVIKR
jgi:hypothetical protein